MDGGAAATMSSPVAAVEIERIRTPNLVGEVCSQCWEWDGDHHPWPSGPTDRDRLGRHSRSWDLGRYLTCSNSASGRGPGTG